MLGVYCIYKIAPTPRNKVVSADRGGGAGGIAADKSHEVRQQAAFPTAQRSPLAPTVYLLHTLCTSPIKTLSGSNMCQKYCTFHGAYKNTYLPILLQGCQSLHTALATKDKLNKLIVIR
jgi:hypothetical protein